MKTHLQHFSLNVADFPKMAAFYKDFLGYFEFKVRNESESHIGFSNGTTGIWIGPTEAQYLKNKFHRKNTGLNHLAFGVSGKEEVDRFATEFLKPRNIPTLYSSPKFCPEYTPTYYAVYFEDPERLKLEVVTGDEFAI